MVQKIKLMLLSASTLFAFALPALATVTVSAQITQTNTNGFLCQGSNGTFTDTPDSSSCGAQAETSGQTLVTTVVNVFSLIVGVAAVIMIIVGGFRYITSGGKQESVAGAKNTILYAIIGLVIVALAQLVVHFVLAKTTAATQ